MTINAEEAKLSLLLTELRLPTIKTFWAEFAQRADNEGWSAARLLSALAEIEVADRGRRRIHRNFIAAKLPHAKSLETLDFKCLPMISKAHVMALASGDGWLDQGQNILAFGPPGTGKTHLAAAIGYSLVENGYKVLFTRTMDLVQKLQLARQSLLLPQAIDKLDKYHLIILDDLSYVRKDQAETSVLFELIAARYERRSTFITANEPFGEWDKIFPDKAMTIATIDRLIHHATIFELNVESYRRKAAIERSKSAKPKPM